MHVRVSCSSTIFGLPVGDAGADAAPPQRLKLTPAQLRQDTKLVNLLLNAVEGAAEDDDGWARVNHVGNQISNQASFDSRNYGYSTLTKLLAATGLFEMVDEGRSSVSVREKLPPEAASRN